MKKIVLILISISFVTQAQMIDEVAQIQKQWAIVNYQTVKDNKEDAFEKLSKVATQLVLDNPKNAHALIWEGIVYSTYAGVAGTFSAGKLAKIAKKSFEAAIEIDESALNGAAHTSLGVLYYKVPGWPLSFGSDKKAMKHLKKGLQLNPTGIDANYFYSEFLYDEKDEYAEAKTHATIAKNATPRPTRPVADEGRKAEIQILIAKIDKELAD